MLDLKALSDPTGSAVLVNISTAAFIPANDGQTAPGVPIAPNAVLKGWGLMSQARGIEEMQLISQDQIDSINGEHWFGGANSLLEIIHFDTYLPFSRGGRNIYYHQVVAGAASVAAYTIDQYPTPNSSGFKNYGQKVMITQLMGALTADVWGSTPVAPATMIPAGKYALLGAYVHQLTSHAFIRFTHADFQGKTPGFPVVDETKATAIGNEPMDAPLWSRTGTQFVALGDIPVFNVTAQGIGLVIQMLDLTADTPHVTLNLQQVS